MVYRQTVQGRNGLNQDTDQVVGPLNHSWNSRDLYLATPGRRSEVIVRLTLLPTRAVDFDTGVSPVDSGCENESFVQW